MAIAPAGTAEMWLKHPKTGALVLVVHEETQQRCLSEGFTLAADPRLPVAAPPPDADPETPAPAPASASASASEPADLSDLTAIADSPSELAVVLETAEARAAIEQAQVQSVRERNTAARAAFGIASPSQAPAPAPAPAQAPRQQRQPGRR